MRALLTNDDGIYSVGINALAYELKKICKVIICAPSAQRSAQSHSITLYRPLILKRWEKNGVIRLSIDGTPADCVKLALLKLVKKADFVVSGINKGLNTGSNILYSGTIGGALEASLLNLPAFAISLEDSPKNDFKRAARLARKIILDLYKKFKSTSAVFNINIPACDNIKGTRITSQEVIPYDDSYEKRVDPRGRTYFWLRGYPEKTFKKKYDKSEELSDAMAIRLGYISITPLKRDLTNHDIILELKANIRPK